MWRRSVRPSTRRRSTNAASSSTVSVDSGESVALGGLISDALPKNHSAIPLLGDIPLLLGALFRNDDNTTLRTELLR